MVYYIIRETPKGQELIFKKDIDGKDLDKWIKIALNINPNDILYILELKDVRRYEYPVKRKYNLNNK